MGFFDKLERKWSRYAVHNLMLYLMIFYVGGFIILRTEPEFYWNYLSLNIPAVLHGQIWRIVTYLMYPPSQNLIFFAFLCFIYYSLGHTLERMWGTFYFNLYIIIGLIANLIGAFIIYAVSGVPIVGITADDLYMSLLLAFAITVPDMQFYLYMIIPIKAKYLGIFYGAILTWEIIAGNWLTRISIICSIFNFILFFTIIKKPAQRVKQAVRRADFQKKAQKPVLNIPRHRCAVCGRTEKDDPNLEFRYCSKCKGNYEYCMDHLYTHVHIGCDAGKKADQEEK